jgi:hypothetical protein
MLLESSAYELILEPRLRLPVISFVSFCASAKIFIKRRKLYSPKTLETVTVWLCRVVSWLPHLAMNYSLHMRVIKSFFPSDTEIPKSQYTKCLTEWPSKTEAWCPALVSWKQVQTLAFKQLSICRLISSVPCIIRTEAYQQHEAQLSETFLSYKFRIKKTLAQATA